MNIPKMGCRVRGGLRARQTPEWGPTGCGNSKGRTHVCVIKTAASSTSSIRPICFGVERLAACDAGRNVQFNEVLMLGGDSPKPGRTFGYRRRRTSRSRRPADQRREKYYSLRQSVAGSTLKAHQGPPSKKLTLVKIRRDPVVPARINPTLQAGIGYRLRERLCQWGAAMKSVMR